MYLTTTIYIGENPYKTQNTHTEYACHQNHLQLWMCPTLYVFYSIFSIQNSLIINHYIFISSLPIKMDERSQIIIIMVCLMLASFASPLTSNTASTTLDSSTDRQAVNHTATTIVLDGVAVPPSSVNPQMLELLGGDGATFGKKPCDCYYPDFCCGLPICCCCSSS